MPDPVTMPLCRCLDCFWGAVCGLVDRDRSGFGPQEGDWHYCREFRPRKGADESPSSIA